MVDTSADAVLDRAPASGRRSPSRPSSSEKESDLIGRTFGQYTVLSSIRRGGMGELFLADRVDETGRVRHKVVLKRLLADYLEDDSYVRMFRSEAKVMSSLSHPNIVRVFDVPDIDEKQCLAMEYVRGRNLHQIVRACHKIKKKLPPHIAIHIAMEILKGLQYAHTFVLPDGQPLDLVHRDVTPGNILVSYSGDVKITDFGISKSSMSTVQTTVGVIKGTTRYLSPEQVRSREPTPATDLFALATVLTEALSGAPLFARGSVPATLFAIVTGERPPVHDLLPFESPELAQVLEKALSVKPGSRYASAEELRAALMKVSLRQGFSCSREELGDYVRALFGDPIELSIDASVRAGEVSTINAMDLNYLFEVKDPVAWSPNESSQEGANLGLRNVREAINNAVAGGGAKRPLSPNSAGSNPLDSSSFERPKGSSNSKDPLEDLSVLLELASEAVLDPSDSTGDLSADENLVATSKEDLARIVERLESRPVQRRSRPVWTLFAAGAAFGIILTAAVLLLSAQQGASSRLVEPPGVHHPASGKKTRFVVTEENIEVVTEVQPAEEEAGTGEGEGEPTVAIEVSVHPTDSSDSPGKADDSEVKKAAGLDGAEIQELEVTSAGSD